MEAPVDRKQEDKVCKMIYSVTWVLELMERPVTFECLSGIQSTQLF
jgi:hypothetical protein